MNKVCECGHIKKYHQYFLERDTSCTNCKCEKFKPKSKGCGKTYYDKKVTCHRNCGDLSYNKIHLCSSCSNSQQDKVCGDDNIWCDYCKPKTLSDKMISVTEKQEDGDVFGNAFWYSDVHETIKKLKEVYCYDWVYDECNFKKGCPFCNKINEIFGKKLI